MNAVGGHYVLATTDGGTGPRPAAGHLGVLVPRLHRHLRQQRAQRVAFDEGRRGLREPGRRPDLEVEQPRVGPYAEGSADWLGIADIACYGNTVCAVGIRQNMGSAILTGNDGWTWGWVAFAPAGGTSPRPIGDSDWISAKTGWTVGGAGAGLPRLRTAASPGRSCADAPRAYLTGTACGSTIRAEGIPSKGTAGRCLPSRPGGRHATLSSSRSPGGCAGRSGVCRGRRGASAAAAPARHRCTRRHGVRGAARGHRPRPQRGLRSPRPRSAGPWETARSS